MPRNAWQVVSESARRVVVQDVEIRRAILQCAPFGRDDLAHKLIPRGVGGDLASDPIVISPDFGTFQFLVVDQ